MQNSGFHILAWLAAIGAVIGLGQLLQSKEVITWKIALGRAIVSAGLAASSSIVLLWLPDAPTAALLGLAAGCNVPHRGTPPGRLMPGGQKAQTPEAAPRPPAWHGEPSGPN